MGKKIQSLDDLKPDSRNANKGTQRGRSLVAKSLEELGAGRSILVDQDGNVIAGNKTLEAAREQGLKTIVIETDGSELVVVKRTDLTLDDPSGKARQLAYADNRSSELGLAWDSEIIQSDLANGVDLTDWFQESELKIITGAFNDDDWEAAFDKVPSGDKRAFQVMSFTLHDSQVDTVTTALKLVKSTNADTEINPNQNGNGNALFLICKEWLETHGNS